MNLIATTYSNNVRFLLRLAAFSLFLGLLTGCGKTTNKQLETEIPPMVICDGKIQPVEVLTSRPMQIGVAYYPERRTKEQWHQDYQKMNEAGINRIRIAEFAWSRIEPEEGVYDWSWLDESIGTAAKYNIEVVLCTPTPTPPIWLSEKYPEILPVNVNGELIRFGGRQHRCYNSSMYNEFSLRIVAEMAKRYGSNKNVVAWQIDNEMGGEVKRCYCTLCKHTFQEYLQSKYTSIDKLNVRWGNAFWSQDYQNFQQIDPPFLFKGELTVKNHPSLELEYSRFASNSIVIFSNKQAEIIHNNSTDQLVTTNRFDYEWGDNLDSYRLSEILDATGFDLYSTELHQIAFYADVNRSLRPDNSWVLEFGTSSDNLQEEMSLLQSRGVEWLYFFKFNPFPSGAEQSNRSLLTITDEEAGNFQVVKKWTDLSDTTEIIRSVPSGIGLYYDFESSWMHFYPAWGKYPERLVYQDYLINKVYRALFENGYSAKIIFVPKEIENVHSLILPLHIKYTRELEEKLIRFIGLGGKVIITEDFFLKNEDNVYQTALPRFYTEVLKVTDNKFLNPTDIHQIILRSDYENGEVVVVSKSAKYEDWKSILNLELYTNPLETN